MYSKKAKLFSACFWLIMLALICLFLFSVVMVFDQIESSEREHCEDFCKSLKQDEEISFNTETSACYCRRGKAVTTANWVDR